MLSFGVYWPPPARFYSQEMVPWGVSGGRFEASERSLGVLSEVLWSFLEAFRSLFKGFWKRLALTNWICDDFELIFGSHGEAFWDLKWFKSHQHSRLDLRRPAKKLNWQNNELWSPIIFNQMSLEVKSMKCVERE